MHAHVVCVCVCIWVKVHFIGPRGNSYCFHKKILIITTLLLLLLLLLLSLLLLRKISSLTNGFQPFGSQVNFELNLILFHT
jgi:hypothetical protein